MGRLAQTIQSSLIQNVSGSLLHFVKKAPEKMAPLDDIPETELWRRYTQSDDQEAREALIFKYLPLVSHITGRIAVKMPPFIVMDDLLSNGVVGLIEAIERFDLSQKTKFITFATIKVRGKIIDYLRSFHWMPRSLQQYAASFTKAKQTLSAKHGRAVSDIEVAEHLGLDYEKYSSIKREIEELSVVSLDNFVALDNDGEGTRWIDVISSSEQAPDDKLIWREQCENIGGAVKGLPEPQRLVVYLYYYEELTLREIGTILKISESRVCQLHREALGKLRRRINRE